jgi:metal-responsive CopG/Arc/MetJ family transcriptional regulator
MPSKKKATFILGLALLNEARAMAEEHGYRSLNSFVEEALRRAVADEKKKKRKEELLEASRDPLFLQDIEETMSAFASADSETARRHIRR